MQLNRLTSTLLNTATTSKYRGAKGDAEQVLSLEPAVACQVLLAAGE